MKRSRAKSISGQKTSELPAGYIHLTEAAFGNEGFVLYQQNDDGRTGCLIFVVIMLVLVGAGVWLALSDRPLIGGLLLVAGLGMYFVSTGIGGSDQEQRRQQRDLEEYGADYFKTGRDHDTPEHHEPQQPEERAPDEWEHDGR